MRRFTCEEEPDRPDFGIAYNFRYVSRCMHWGGTAPTAPGKMSYMYSSATPYIDPITGVPQNRPDVGAATYQENVIGDNFLHFAASQYDVVGNEYGTSLNSGFTRWAGNNNGHVTLKVYNQYEEHQGTWLYERQAIAGCAGQVCGGNLYFRLIGQTEIVNGQTQVDMWANNPSGCPGPGWPGVDIIMNEYYYIKGNLNVIGIRPGEKLHEAMISEVEWTKTINLKENYLITDDIVTSEFKSYNSFDSLMPDSEVYEFLKENRVL